MDEFYDGAACTACDLNCGPNMSCTAAVASCFRCDEKNLTCDKDGALACRPYSTYNSTDKLCECPTDFYITQPSEKCYQGWVFYALTQVSEWLTDDSGNDRWGLMGSTDISFENGGGPNPDITNG